MGELLVGYARVSTRDQHPEAQHDVLTAAGCDEIFLDKASGKLARRPELDKALLSANRAGDTLVVTKLDRLARSVPDARAIADELTAREVKLNIGGSVYDPTDPIGKLLFTALSMVAEFEADLARLRTREGMTIAKAKGRLRGKKPKLSPSQEAYLVALHRAGRHTTTELAELFTVARSTVYRTVYRAIHRAGTNPR
ncbi:MAG: recombinase family protein [Pseudonocardiaceae bacterium]